MRIGELAKHSGVPASTIRYYEQQKLMPPSVRTASGYRTYNQQAIDRLTVIRFSQSLGFALDEIPKLIDDSGNWDHDRLIERLNQKKREMDELIAQLNNKNRTLSQLVDTLSGTWEKGECLHQDELTKLLKESDFQ